MNHFESLKFIRSEAKKHGLTFSRQGRCINSNGEPVYSFSLRRSPNKVSMLIIVRDCLTLETSFEIACSGELEIYK